MALFKPLLGDSSRISLDITPFHEGYVYFTTDGFLYVDVNIGTQESPNNQRIQINGTTNPVFNETITITEDNVSTIAIPFICTLPKALMVYQDGVLLTQGENYTFENNTITLVDYTCNTGDIFTFIYFAGEIASVATKDYVDNLFNSLINSEEVQY